MAIRTKAFTLRAGDRTALTEFLATLINANNIRTSESTVDGIATITVTWDDTTPAPDSDVTVVLAADEEGTYYLSDLSTTGMTFDADAGKNIAPFTAKRKLFPALTVNQETSNGSPITVVSDVKKKGTYGIEVTKKTLPTAVTGATTDGDTLTGSGTIGSPAALRRVRVDDDTLTGSGVATSLLAIKKVYSDATLTGQGTAIAPLAVASPGVGGVSDRNFEASADMTGDPSILSPSGRLDYVGRRPLYTILNSNVLETWYSLTMNGYLLQSYYRTDTNSAADIGLLILGTSDTANGGLPVRLRHIFGAGERFIPSGLSLIYQAIGHIFSWTQEGSAGNFSLILKRWRWEIPHERDGYSDGNRKYPGKFTDVLTVSGGAIWDQAQGWIDQGSSGKLYAGIHADNNPTFEQNFYQHANWSGDSGGWSAAIDFHSLMSLGSANDVWLTGATDWNNGADIILGASYKDAGDIRRVGAFYSSNGGSSFGSLITDTTYSNENMSKVFYKNGIVWAFSIDFGGTSLRLWAMDPAAPAAGFTEMDLSASANLTDTYLGIASVNVTEIGNSLVACANTLALHWYDVSAVTADGFGVISGTVVHTLTSASDNGIEAVPPLGREVVGHGLLVAAPAAGLYVSRGILANEQHTEAELLPIFVTDLDAAYQALFVPTDGRLE